MLIEKRFSNIEVLLSRSASMFRVGGKAHLIFIQSRIVLCFCFQELVNDNDSEVTHYAKNLYASEDRLIYFFFDAPHLVKAVRNALSNSGSGNPGQDIWNRIEKSSKAGQGKKSLISTFALLDITFRFTCGLSGLY